MAEATVRRLNAAIATIEQSVEQFIASGGLLVSADHDYHVGVHLWQRPTACAFMTVIGETYQSIGAHGGDVIARSVQSLGIELEEARAFNAGFEGWKPKRIDRNWDQAFVVAGREICKRFAFDGTLLSECVRVSGRKG